ncbi:MAG: leucine-rich repeat protein, partial [Clostridiaceae bacterium]|nr:leucine-rich repeat protein [Clostridiaceae bacterium]MBW4858491.1 leucine-rich repeat protein [Clostridiaceae bacterium]MBW4869323.1 leucine-rich repeat protein [Clostridiaceae bacterium]
MMKRNLQLWAIVLIGSILLTSFPFAVFAQDSTESNVPTPEELGFKFNVEKKEITKYKGNETEINIPSEFNINGKVVPVESIGFMAFAGNEAITKVTIPGSIKTIGKSAFILCSNLQELTLQKGLVEIRESAFSNTEISKVHIPSSVKTIGKEAFSDCMNLEEVTLDEGLEVISEGAFRKTGIKEITIPSTVEKIGKNIFYMNKVIEKITIMNNKENIDIAEKAFPKDIEVIYKGNEQPEEKENVVPDPNLRKAINRYINKEERTDDQPIIKEDLMGMQKLNLDEISEEERKEIKDISGLENLTNAYSLYLKGTSVTNLEPIKNLKNLETIQLGGSCYAEGHAPWHGHDNTKWRSPLKDVSILANLENLNTIWINDSNVEDISPLRDLKKLQKAHLQRNKVNSVECLRDAPIASKIGNQLFLQGNCIGDFSPLKDKEALRGTGTVGQTVKIIPDGIEFYNPLKYRDGKYIILPENDYIENTGDIGDKLKIIKAPETEDIIEMKLGTSYNADTLFVDISNVRDKIEDLDLEKYKVHFDVYGKQENAMIGTIYNSNVQVWNNKGQELTNDNNLSYIWELPDGKYTYKVSHPDYKDVEGEFEVKGEATKVEVPLSYDLEKPGNYAYPTIESLEILDRATKRVLGKGTFDGQIISVVIEDPKDRELVYNGRAMIKAETKNALSYECNTEASPSSTKFTETDGSIDDLNGKYSSVDHPFKKDSLTYMMLKGKGGLENHYGIVIKEKENQHAVIFNTSADKSGTSLGSLRIPTGNLSANKYWEVFRFVQLVDHGEKAIEPLKYIKDTYDKVARLYHKGGAFEGWYYKKDWVQKFDFDEPIEKDVEIHARFSNSSNINEFPDPFTVRFVGPERDGVNEGKKTYARLYYNKNGEWVERYHGSDPVKVQKVGDELRFKIDIVDEEYDLGYLCAMYNGRKLPITQHKDGSFSFVPGPSQDSSIFNKNVVYYDIIKKEYQKNSFDVNKQHNIHLLSEGSPLGPTLVLENMSSPYNSFNIAQEGNTVLLRVGGYELEDVFVKSSSGKNINLIQVKDEEITEKGYKNQYYKFTMPSEDVDIIARGEGVTPTVDRLLTFKVKDENGNEIDPSKVEKLVVSTAPYEYIIKDITQPTKIASNASGRGYNYMLSIKGQGAFYGRFHLDKDRPDEVVLTIDMSEEIKKTKEDVQRLVDVAKGVLKEKDKYSTKSIENLEAEIENAEQAIKLQSGYNKAFFELTNAIDGLEKLEDPEVPEVDKTKLKEAIDEAKKIGTEGKTEESVKALNETISRGKEILEKKEATQEEVNNAVKEIEIAISNLKDKEEPEIDKTKLEEVINRAEKVDIEGKTEESVKTLENAILKGKEILGKEKVTQEEIDSVVRAIEAAMSNLEDKEEPEPKPEIDKTKLKEVLNKAEKIDIKDKTEESIKDLNNAISKGKEIFESKTATQEEVNKTLELLKAAING